MERSRKIRLIYSVFLAVFTVVIGVLFIAEAAELYFAGAASLGTDRGMYSREEVGGRLLEMLALLILWLIAAIVGFFSFTFLPAPGKKRGKTDSAALYRRLRHRIAAEKDPAAYSALVRAERVRLGVRIFTAVFCLLAAVMSIVYLATASHFTSLSELNANILHMVANVLPWMGSAFVLLILEVVFEGLFAGKMLPRLKRLTGGPYTPSAWERRAERAEAVLGHRNTVLGVRIVLFVLAAVFIGLGIWNGGAHSVLIKAINICTECIGLG